ncbi:hypothetical protein O181_094374 [Austropuccinia psidii MF-1]|uniref:CCHC-type domain-containing protein n=1 Tax=Austropuccinia psidii MF-1 TaxID=1389203 RepID=A0A9Q3PAS0_9BASI|nr:hypothetical protein [Austropuccinia psidii MF-1]
MEHGQQEVQPSIPLEELAASCQKICLKELEFKVLMVITKGWDPTRQRTTDPDRAYSDFFRLTRSRPNKLSSGFTSFRNQNINGQESQFFTIPGRFQEKTRTQGKKQELFQPKAERVRPNDPEAVGLGERSTQEPEIVVHTSKISSPINRNITHTQIEHNVDIPESNALWLKMSQYAEQTQNLFAELQTSHEMIKELTASMEKIFKTLQERHAHLSKASEETNKRLNQVFEEQHHRKRDRVEIKEKPRERVAEVPKKKNSCHNCGSTDHHANNCPKEKKKVYTIEKVPEEESPTEDSESDYMGNAIRQQSDEEQDPREEFQWEYQEET